MAIREPKYWGTWKGNVILAIARDAREKTWIELLEETGLNAAALRKAIAELYNINAVEKIGEGKKAKYRVKDHGLYDEYRRFLKSNSILAADRKNESPPPARSAKTRKDILVERIELWKRDSGLKFSLEPKHFFLEGMYLDELSKRLINDATLEVLAVNPYVDHCDLSNVLRGAAKKAQVFLVTQPPQDNDRHAEDRQEYHKTLTQEGVKMIYNKKIHAKLIVVDNLVAIVSSMNLYGSSSGGVSIEAGLVSIEETVVKSVASSIRNLIERPESKKIESHGKT